MLLHLWTFSLPLLLNYCLHTAHCTAPRCSWIGFTRSGRYLCLFLSDPLWKHLLHTRHFTWCGHWNGSTCSFWPGSLWSLWYLALYPSLESCPVPLLFGDTDCPQVLAGDVSPPLLCSPEWAGLLQQPNTHTHTHALWTVNLVTNRIAMPSLSCRYLKSNSRKL